MQRSGNIIKRSVDIAQSKAFNAHIVKGESVVDIRKLRAGTGFITYDEGYGNTQSWRTLLNINYKLTKTFLRTTNLKQIMGQIITWDNVMNAALSMPLVKVNRNKFLQREFANYGNNTDQLCNKRPIDLYDSEIVEKVANSIIKSHLIEVTAISAAAGIPGGFAMLGTIPADMTQFYWHVLVLAQKLGYIYGWTDLLDDHGKINESTRIELTLFVGVMLGSDVANTAIREIARGFAEQVAKRLPRQALTKTIYYPIIKDIAKWIGVKITKESFAKSVSKVIPLLGGALSGTVTYVTFKPMAKRLQEHLREQMK